MSESASLPRLPRAERPFAHHDHPAGVRRRTRLTGAEG